MKLVHDTMEGRYYEQLKDLVSDNQDGDKTTSDLECMSESCWKQQKTEEVQLSDALPRGHYITGFNHIVLYTIH